MKKKTKFVVEPFNNIQIVGINTSIPDYQLAWNLNNVLKLNLVKYRNITTDGENFFSFYLYDAGENSNTFNLVALNNEEVKWVSFSPQTDYIFIVRNYIKESEFQQFLTNIKSISKVNHAYVIDLQNNSKIGTILEDIELHEMDVVDEMNRKLKSSNRY